MEEKMRILNMVSEGKITPEEAEKLLTALDTETQNHIPAETVNLDEKFLYIKVEPKNGKSSDRVSVKVPFGLVKAGLNIAGLIPQDAQDKINSTMNEKGLNFNLKDINKDNIQEILTSLEQFTVDVDTEEAAIQVFCR